MRFIHILKVPGPVWISVGLTPGVDSARMIEVVKISSKGLVLLIIIVILTKI